MGESSRKVSQRKLLCVVSPVSGVFSDRQRYKMIQLRANQVEPIEKAISFFQEKKPKRETEKINHGNPLIKTTLWQDQNEQQLIITRIM